VLRNPPGGRQFVLPCRAWRMSSKWAETKPRKKRAAHGTLLLRGGRVSPPLTVAVWRRRWMIAVASGTYWRRLEYQGACGGLLAIAGKERSGQRSALSTLALQSATAEQ